MLDESTDLSWALFYCLCLLLPPADKLLYIQMISSIELIAVSLGRELKDEPQHGHTYTMDGGSHNPAAVSWQHQCFCLLLLAG